MKYIINKDTKQITKTENQVKEIRRKYIPRKVSVRILANEYGVASNNIYQIITYKKWKNI
jgi:hypothetical protein